MQVTECPEYKDQIIKFDLVFYYEASYKVSTPWVEATNQEIKNTSTLMEINNFDQRKLQTVHQLISHFQPTSTTSMFSSKSHFSASLFFKRGNSNKGKAQSLHCIYLSFLCESKEGCRSHRPTFSYEPFPWRWSRDAVIAPFPPSWHTFPLTGRIQRPKKMEDKVAEGFKTSLGLVWSYEVYGGTYHGFILYKPVSP